MGPSKLNKLWGCKGHSSALGWAGLTSSPGSSFGQHNVKRTLMLSGSDQSKDTEVGKGLEGPHEEWLKDPGSSSWRKGD